MTSASETCCEADWNSESPVATTLRCALLVALGNGNGFIQFSILESAGHLLHKDARLLARGTVHKRRSIMTPKE